MECKKSISELISSLKSAFRPSQYDDVAKLLVARNDQQKQIVETLKKENEDLRKEKKPPAAASRVLERERTAEEIYQELMEKNITNNAMEEVEKLKMENEKLKMENEALGGSAEELYRRMAEMEKAIDALKNDMLRPPEKGIDASFNSAPKTNRILAVDDAVFSSDDNYSSKRKKVVKKIEPRGTPNSSKGKLWKFHGEMVADLTRNDVLCMEAVCVLNRHRSSVQESLKKTSEGTTSSLKFDDLLRKASNLAKFLTDGDPQSRLKKSVAELKSSSHSISECREIAVELSKQLFELYKKNEDLLVNES